VGRRHSHGKFGDLRRNILGQPEVDLESAVHKAGRGTGVEHLGESIVLDQNLNRYDRTGY
jgi:hypothetical protein